MDETSRAIVAGIADAIGDAPPAPVPGAGDAVAEACAAELRLLQPEVRSDRAAVDSMLAPGFTEFGQSGRSWTRAEMMDAIGGFESSSTAVQVEALRGRELAPDIVLVTYESSGARGTVRRSSIWKRNPAGWQVEFHQGTPTA